MIKLLIHNHNFDSFPFYNLIAGLGFLHGFSPPVVAGGGESDLKMIIVMSP